MNKLGFISLDIILSVLLFTIIILIINNVVTYSCKSIGMLDLKFRVMETTYNRILTLDEKELGYVESISLDRDHKLEIEFREKIEKEFYNIYIIIAREIDKDNKVSEFEYAKIYEK